MTADVVERGAGREGASRHRWGDARPTQTLERGVDSVARTPADDRVQWSEPPRTVVFKGNVERSVEVPRVLRQILFCDVAEIPGLGQSLLTWLSSVAPVEAVAAEFWLLKELNRQWNDEDPAQEHNRLAALEILTRRRAKGALDLLVERLRAQVSPSHALLLSLLACLEPPERASEQCRRAVRHIVSQTTSFGESWKAAVFLEALTESLSTYPEDVSQAALARAATLEGPELAQVLDILATAVKLHSAQHALLNDVEQTIGTSWARWLSPASMNRPNAPGVLGGMLQIFACLGAEKAEVKLRELDGHPLRTRVLFQFVRRRPERITREIRRSCYEELIGEFLERRQEQSFQKLTEIAGDDGEFHGALRARLSRKD